MATQGLQFHFVAGIIPVTLMTALYSRVVYSLWFKQHQNNSENTNQVVFVND